MTPGRYLRRSKPYLIFAVALIVLIAAVILVVRQARSMSSAQKPDPSSTAQTQPSQDAADEPQPSTPSEPDAPTENVYVPPFDGTVTPLANGLLLAAYDEAQLKLTSDAQLDSYTSVTDGQIARIDVQKLRSSMELLKKDELSRIVIGVLQGDYYAAPATEDISITAMTDADGELAAKLSAESYGGAPAVAAAKHSTLCRMTGRCSKTGAKVISPSAQTAAIPAEARSWTRASHSFFRTVARATTQTARLEAVFDYIRDNFKYLSMAHYDASTTDWAQEAAEAFLQQRKGNCFCFAAAFMYCARRLGYQAYVVAGPLARKRPDVRALGPVARTLELCGDGAAPAKKAGAQIVRPRLHAPGRDLRLCPVPRRLA